ncbi:MAG: heme o synthase [Planctomycetota bacterium]
MSGVLETTAVPAGAIVKARAFLELGKLRLSSLAIFAVVAGLYLGTPSGISVDTALLVSTTIGTLLIAVAGNALNMLLERDVDPLMERTRGRPLPTRRLTPREVRIFGVACAAIGIFVLAVSTNWLATGLCALVLVTYVFVYTPLKRVSEFNTIVGAVPGALPPVVGYVAAKGMIDVAAAVLFAILFLWQIPHFLAISWRYRHDYARGGMKMLAVRDVEGRMIRRQMLVYTFALIAVSMLPYRFAMTGGIYLASAALLGFVFAVPVFCAAVLRWEAAVRQTFVVSIIYLPLLLGVMVLDRT